MFDRFGGHTAIAPTHAHTSHTHARACAYHRPATPPPFPSPCVFPLSCRHDGERPPEHPRPVSFGVQSSNQRHPQTRQLEELVLHRRRLRVSRSTWSRSSLACRAFIHCIRLGSVRACVCVCACVYVRAFMCVYAIGWIRHCRLCACRLSFVRTGGAAVALTIVCLRVYLTVRPDRCGIHQQPSGSRPHHPHPQAHQKRVPHR